MRYIFDLEADGLLEDATKIYVVSYYNLDTKKSGSLHGQEKIRKFFRSASFLCGHNICRYDIPVIEKLLRIKIDCTIVDTLALSWYLFPKRIKHGLDDWGNDLGIKKPEIKDWKNLTVEEYTFRCEEDIKINLLLWKKINSKLNKLYKGLDKDRNRIISYLTFKLQCAANQERLKWKLDKDLCIKKLAELEEAKIEKESILTQAMPDVPHIVKRTRPTKPFKKDGTPSVAGAKWYVLLKNKNLPKDYEGEVDEIIRYEAPKPSSTVQVKNWLFSLGWEPISFDYKKDDDGNERAIPQVRVSNDGVKELCPSVLKLVEKEPAIEALEGVTVLQHRIGLLKGFLANEKDGYVKAEIAGFTNTLRFKHKIIVNLPGVNKPYGDIIRGVLTCEDDEVLIGSDVSSLEDNTKRHYMYEHDPEYVIEMSADGFDPHLDLAKAAGVCNQHDLDLYVAKDKQTLAWLKPIRGQYKVGNYSCVYGVGAPKLARTLGISKEQAKKIIDAYWERNWAVAKVAKEADVVYVDGEMWLHNPVSGFFLSLRYDKDRFSTLNQSTGVYCFDLWVRECIKYDLDIIGQFHDEIIVRTKKGTEEQVYKIIKQGMINVNNKLKLNVILYVDVEKGKTYADVH